MTTALHIHLLAHVCTALLSKLPLLHLGRRAMCAYTGKANVLVETIGVCPNTASYNNLLVLAVVLGTNAAPWALESTMDFTP